MVRSRRTLLAFTAAGAAMLAGCTFLIPFDDVALPDDGGGGGSETSNGFDGGAGSDADDPVDSALRDGASVRDALANPDACVGKTDGKYCGGDLITWPPPGTKDDLITCTKSVVSVRTCTGGLGCIRMINGYPDQCDECVAKADGFYCGRDMTGWDAKNAEQRVHCQNKGEVGLQLCANGCTSMGAASFCK
jgi:hypothetical protein